MSEIVKGVQEFVADISEELKSDLEKTFQLERIKKKTLILEENHYCRKLFFLESGIARTFYYHNDDEGTSWVYREGQFLTSWHSFYLQGKSYESIETLEDCKIYSISFASYQKLMMKHLHFERFARLLSETQIAYLDLFYKGFMMMSAKERYEQLLSYFPDIELRVQVGQIASLLGISRETLSRIRSR